jgi:excinuclease UvrABC nuclease subunit
MNKQVIIKGIAFKGQFPINFSFEKKPGVYIVANPKNKIADIGETENLKERISVYKKNKKWSVWYCDETSQRARQKIKKFISEKYQFTQAQI